MAAVIEVLRLQHGADDFQPSLSEIESLKSDVYISKQSYTLSSLFNAVDNKEPAEETPIRSFSNKDCLSLISHLKTAIATSKRKSDRPDDQERSTDDKESPTLDSDGLSGWEAIAVEFQLDIDEDIELTDKQKKVVKRLKFLMSKGQMLALIQGIPGAGKTTTAKSLVIELGIKCLFTGTTATASSRSLPIL